MITAYLLEEEVCPSGPKQERAGVGAHGRSSREEEVCLVLEQFALKASNKEALVKGRSYGLILMANLAMAGGLPFYS